MIYKRWLWTLYLFLNLGLTAAPVASVLKVYEADRFIADDRPEYASLNYDDSSWEKNIRITAWQETQKYSSYEGTAWYRIYFDVPDHSIEFDYSVIIPVQYSGSSIYMNGVLLGHTQENPFDNSHKLGLPVFMDIPPDVLIAGKNVLAVRSASNDGLGGFRDYPVSIGVKKELSKIWYRNLIWNSGLVFIFIFIAIYFSIYYSRSSASNYYIYFSLMSFSLGLWIFTYKGFTFYVFNTYLVDIIGTYLGGILFTPMLVSFLHSFFEIKKHVVVKAFEYAFYLLCVVLLGEFFFTGHIYFFNHRIFTVFITLVNIGTLYAFVVNGRAIRQKKYMAKRAMYGLLALGVALTLLVVSQLSLYFGETYMAEGYFVMVIVFASVLASRYNQINRELIDAHEDLKELDKMKDSFLAATSHELKTPITGIIGLSETMLLSKNEPVTPRQEEVLRLIQHSGKRLADLVNDLLDAAQLKQKKIILNQDSVDLSRVVDRAFMICEPLLAGKKLSLVNKINSNLPMVYADEDRLEQIFINLINNAIKFSTDGNIEVSAKIDTTGESVNISIKDQGIGIPEDQFDIIFEPLQQVNSGDSRKYGGTGLGLSITKNLVELHGGHIYVESNDVQGVVFHFDMPVSDKKKSSRAGRKGALKEAEVQRKTKSGGKRKKGRSKPGKGKTILIADDDMVNVRILSDSLIDAGYEVIACHTSRQVYDTLFLDEQIPDLLLLDIMMPGKTGYELTRIIRDKYPIDSLPIVLITAKTRKEDMEMGFHSGANDYITKPFLMPEVISRIENQFMLMEAYSTKTKLEDFTTEIQLSKKLHKSVIPAGLPPIDHVDMHIKQKFKYEISGDYYDFLSLDKKHFGFLLCDVSTHGVAATVISAMIKVAFIQMESLFDSPTHLVTQMNYLLSDYLNQFFITLSYTYFDMANYQIKYASAGHTSLILYRQKEKRCLEYQAEGNALGLNPRLQIETKSMSVAKGDKIILYSDGIVNTKNEHDELFTEEMIMDIVRRNPEKNNNALANEVIQAVKKWCADDEFPQDDITIAIFDIQ